MAIQDTRKQIFQYSLVSLLLFFIFPPLAIAPILMLIFNLGYIKGVFYHLSYIGIVFLIVFIIETIKAPYNIKGNAFELLINLFTYIILVSLIAIYSFYIFKSNKNFLIKLILVSLPYVIIFSLFIYYETKTGFSFITFSKTIEFFKDFSEFNSIAKKIDFVLKTILPRLFIPISFLLSFLIEQHFSFYLNRNSSFTILEEISQIKLNKFILYLTVLLLYILILFQFILKINNNIIMIITYNIVFSFVMIYVIYGYSFLSYFLKKSVFNKLFLNTFFIIILSLVIVIYSYYLIPSLIIILFILGIIDHSFNIKKI